LAYEDEIDFDDHTLYLYGDKLYKQLTGLIFFEVKINLKRFELLPGKYEVIELEEQEHMVALPNREEVVFHYGIYKKYS